MLYITSKKLLFKAIKLIRAFPVHICDNNRFLMQFNNANSGDAHAALFLRSLHITEFSLRVWTLTIPVLKLEPVHFILVDVSKNAG